MPEGGWPLSTRNTGNTKKRAASLGDVARLAGVSPQTASRVSTGSSLVAPETAARVREAMQRLGYSPNKAARALRQGAYKAIGVVTQQLERTGESLTTAGIVDAAEKHGYTVTVVQVSQPETDELQRALTRLSELPIDGLLIVRIGHASSDLVTLPPQLPVTVCDSRLNSYYPSVNADQVQGVSELMDHLLALGHTEIGHVSGAPDSYPTVVRRAAFQHALLGAVLPTGKVWDGDWTMESGFQVGAKIIEDPDVTAVFCANDEMAFGLMSYLQGRGVRVPEDISIVGFDGTNLSRYTNPPLTTVDQHFDRIAARAVDQLMAQITGSKPVSLDPVLTPVTFVVRESTAPPRKR